MIRAVVLDYGGVISCPQGGAERRAMQSLVGAPGQAFHAAYWRHRADYDRGELTSRQYWDAVTTTLGAPDIGNRHDELVELDAAGWSATDGAMTALARDLSGRVRLGLLSNMPADVRDRLRAGVDDVAPFAAQVYSCDIGATKPAPDAYEAVCRALGVPLADALMVDDRAENVEGAQRAGMRAMRFTGAVALEERLRQHLGAHANGA